MTGGETAVPGQAGTLILHLPGEPGAQFEVRSVDPKGVVHVRFVEGRQQPAFAEAIRRMIKASGLSGRAA